MNLASHLPSLPAACLREVASAKAGDRDRVKGG